MIALREVDIVPYQDYIPCRTAFIDAHTPGSDQKENYTIVGAGVSESPDQHVHIKRSPGFNIGAAAQPAVCTNSLHSHNTAEVFIIHSGTWRFYWGQDGGEGSVTLNPGDTVSLPTHMFRGFKNITEPSADNPTGYGFMFAVLGGNDAGGGVVWAPQVLEDARYHGLILMENGQLIDTKKGETLPEGVARMQPVSGDDLAMHNRNKINDAGDIVVTRDQGGEFEILIGEMEGAHIRERPGFRLLRWKAQAGGTVGHPRDRDMVLIVNKGAIGLSATGKTGAVDEEEANENEAGDKEATEAETKTLNAGDTAYLVKSEDGFSMKAGPDGAEVFVVRPTDDTPGETDYV